MEGDDLNSRRLNGCAQCPGLTPPAETLDPAPQSPVSPVGHSNRDGLASASPVDPEVAVQGEDHASRVLFGQADEARISQGHGHVMVLHHHPPDRAGFIGQPKRHIEDAAIDQRDHRFLRSGGKTMREKTCLGNDCFAGEERGSDPGPLFPRPAVMRVAGVEEGNQWTRIENDPRVHRPKPRM